MRVVPKIQKRCQVSCISFDIQIEFVQLNLNLKFLVISQTSKLLCNMESFKYSMDMSHIFVAAFNSKFQSFWLLHFHLLKVVQKNEELNWCEEAAVAIGNLSAASAL